MPHPASTDDRARAAGERRRDALDGLRAIAVVLVIAFHAGVAAWDGGFVGVDVFFVLSGYLITGLLLREIATDRLRIPTFYARRFRRLLPASLATIATVLVLAPGVLGPLVARQLPADVVAATTFLANWHFIDQATDYFAGSDNSPLLHFWSLSVEEQFYLGFPLALAGLHALGRRLHRPAIVGGGIALAGAVSLALALHWRETLPARAYFGTDTRLYQLAAGALIAWWFHRQPEPDGDPPRRSWGDPVAALAIIAVVALGTDALSLDPIVRGAYVAAAVSALLVVLHRRAAPRVDAVLSVAPLPQLGRVSYAMYLWHWPAIVALTATTALEPLAVFAISTAVSTALAVFSQALIERPVRRPGWLDDRPAAVLMAGVVALALVAVSAAPVLTRGERDRLVLERAGAPGHGQPLAHGEAVDVTPDRLPTLDRLEQFTRSAVATPFVKDSGCGPERIDACTRLPGPGTRIHVIGDSVTAQWLTALEAVGAERGWQITATMAPSCMWEWGIRVDPDSTDGIGRRRDQECVESKPAWYQEVVPAIAPDIVLIAARLRADDATIRPSDDAVDGLVGHAAALAAADRSVRSLVATGARVVVFLPTPLPTLEVPHCLSTASTAAECSFVADETSSFATRLAGTVDAAGGRAESVTDLICPRFPTCDPIVDDVVVWRDTLHLTTFFVEHIASRIADRVEPPATAND